MGAVGKIDPSSEGRMVQQLRHAKHEYACPPAAPRVDILAPAGEAKKTDDGERGLRPAHLGDGDNPTPALRRACLQV